MKTSPKKNRWLYLVLAIVLVALLASSLLFPLITTALRDRRTPTPSPITTLSPQQVGELDAKAKGYELVLQREPDNKTALQGLVEVKLEQGAIADALIPLERLAKINPQRPDYTILLAQAREYLGDVEGAFQAYDTILKLNPGDINALQGAITLQLKQNRPEAAIGRLQETLKTAAQANAANPNSVDVTSVQLLLGQVYAQQKRYTEAIEVYNQTIKTNPQDFRPVLAQAVVYKQQGELDRAKPLFALAVSLAPPKYKDQIKLMETELSQPTPSPTPES